MPLNYGTLEHFIRNPDGSYSQMVTEVSAIQRANQVGQLYIAHHEAIDVEIAASVWIEYAVGARAVVSVDRSVSAEGAFSIRIWEGATYTPTAVPIEFGPSPANLAVASNPATTALRVVTAGISTTGATLRAHNRVLSAGNNRGVGLTGGAGAVLKPNTNYLLQATNDNGAGNDFTFDWVFYEV